MATIFTFPCGGCGRRYTVYYPKALLYELSGSGTRQMGQQEDEEDARTGAVEAARRRAEAAGNIWIDAAAVQATVCACGKRLDLNIAHHPRVPQSKTAGRGRQTGFVQLPTKPAKPGAPTGGPHGRHGS
ncbi:MAG: hypothetical protein HY334_01920 [Armatimonadetes bacterium]|nr:hypothetical protein [Armatimonadota bacterium]